MINATQQNLYSFEEYITYDDHSDNQYELVDGKLEIMTPPTFLHILICDMIRDALKSEIEQLQLPWLATRESGIRTGINKSRIADVCVLTKEQVMSSLNQAGICQTPPLLIVEVVSAESIKRDYRYKRCSAVLGVSPISDYIKKRSEYAASGVGEYWIVDPLENKVTILILDEGLYEEQIYTDNQAIVSPTFSQIELTAEKIFSMKDLSK